MSSQLEFNSEKARNISAAGKNQSLKRISRDFLYKTGPYKYTYNFTWLGRPIVQLPQDMIAMQELIWSLKPDLIVETGIAHGGSLIFYASILELIGKGLVLGVDIDIRKHNRKAIESHKLSRRIRMIQGSSVDKAIADKVFKFAASRKKVLVVLDSNHTHEHVLEELELYSPLLKKGGYIVVFDTVVEDMTTPPYNYKYPGRPWGKGNNPKTAVRNFLRTHKEFEVDKSIESKLLITVAPDGYLRRIR